MPRGIRGSKALRIVAMIAIVAHHYTVHGGVQDHTASAGTAIVLSSIGAFGKWGVDVFVLVSAFFMDRTPRRGKSLSSVYSQVLPVSWLILLTAAIVGIHLSPRDIQKGLFPVVFGEYWFVTSFVVLVLIAPYLSMVADALTGRQHRRLLLAGIALWSVLTLTDGVRLEISNLAWFALLYLMAAYVRRYPLPGDARLWGTVTIASAVLLATLPPLLASALIARGSAPATVGWAMDVYASAESPLAVASALAIVVWATKARPWASGVVNYWAAAAFGVYLIHDNPLVRRFVWDRFVDTSAAAGQWWLPLHAVAWTLAIYVACSLVIFALQPTVFRATHAVTERARVRIEARLARPDAAEGAPAQS
ncbi:acyltransferase [Demequina litorisediminis]